MKNKYILKNTSQKHIRATKKILLIKIFQYNNRKIKRILFIINQRGLKRKKIDKN